MPIIPTPPTIAPVAGPPDPWANASFYDVVLTNTMNALIASGRYTPGPLIMQLAVAGAAQIMVQTGRWPGTPIAVMTLEEAEAVFQRMGLGK